MSKIGYAFLEAIQRDKEGPSGIVAGVRRNIDLHHYADRLGVSTSGIRDALGNRLTALNKSLPEEGCLRTSLEKQLVATVESDIAEGRPLVFVRGGKLDRAHYAARLGKTGVALGRSCKHVLRDLDYRFGGPSRPEARLSEMRDWLETKFQQGTLPIRDKSFERKEFYHAFGLNSGISRYPGVRALLDEFDGRIADGRYAPAATIEDMHRLTEALKDPQLNRNKLSVSRPALERALGISAARLDRPPFIQEIRTAEKRITERAQQSDIDPYFAGRVFTFSDLAELFSTAFLRALGVRFKAAFSHYRDAGNIKAEYLTLRNFLSWVGRTADEDARCRRLVACTSSGRVLDEEAWHQTVFAYREFIAAEIARGSRSKRQAGKTVKNLRRVLAAMVPFLPELETKLAGVKYARSFNVPRPSLAEALPKSSPAKKNNYIDFTETMLRQAAGRYSVALDSDEAARFVTVLASELDRSEDLPSDLSHAVLLVLGRRLNSIREAASALLQTARADLELGKSLLADADAECESFLARWEHASRSERQEIARRLFPDPSKLDDDEAQMALRRGRANLLALAVYEFGGILPGPANAEALSRFGQFYKKRFLEFGSWRRLAPLLNPSKDVCGAALTLYLIESGANVSVGRTLEFRCVEESNQPGFKLVTGHKARAKGKPIYAELAANSEAIQALEWYEANTSRYRAMVDKNAAKCLFLVQDGERIQEASASWYTDWFKRFASVIPGLEHVRVVPSMIRPSVLLKAALENDGRLQVGRAIGQHGETVTRGYQERLPVRLLRDQHMRRFQQLFETSVLQNVADVAAKLGISAEDFEVRIKELQASGLGTLCSDPYARPGSEGQRCKILDCWRECPQLLVIAEVESIALLQIWQASLEEVRGDWERDHPERWGEVWLPWLCLTDVVQKRMSRGPLLLIWRKAQKRAAELYAQPDFVAPRPF